MATVDIPAAVTDIPAAPVAETTAGATAHPATPLAIAPIAAPPAIYPAFSQPVQRIVGVRNILDSAACGHL